MTRSLVTASLFAALAVAFGTPDVEARCCRVRHHRNRCCSPAYGYGTSPSYQFGSSSQYGGACCQSGTVTTTQYSMATSGSTSWTANYPDTQNYQGYAAPTTIETRPKTSETAPAAGPAPAGATPAEEAPRPGTE